MANKFFGLIFVQCPGQQFFSHVETVLPVLRRVIEPRHEKTSNVVSDQV